MKITKIRIHNFRSILDAEIDAHDFLMFVGANNAGKSNVINALRCFYDDLKWSEADIPKCGNPDSKSWVEITFVLSDDEWVSLAEKYKEGVSVPQIVLRRYFRGEKAKSGQSNIYAIVNGIEKDEFFYGAKQVSAAKCGNIIYIPALTTPEEQMKTTGPSPFREILNFMLKRVLVNSDAYSHLKEAFNALNEEARREDGFLTEIARPINEALDQWNIKIDLSIDTISPDDITKSLVKPTYVDAHFAEEKLDLKRHGHGFQRSLIYEMIRIAPRFRELKVSEKKEFNPDFTLILFEEPEAFLHPAQQESMAYHLRKLGEESGQQVFVTSHSPVFVGKSSDNLCQICRIQKENGVSAVYQLMEQQMFELLKSGGDFRMEIQNHLDSPEINGAEKKRLQNKYGEIKSEEIANQYERFRLQLWLDSERASMFFADKVILVEGATEKALFNYLLANDWYDLMKERIYVVDAMGKFNFHRYIGLFEAFGIYHGIMFDNDNERGEHIAVNQLIRKKKNRFTLSDPHEFDSCLEKYLGLDLPDKDYTKPLHILKALEDKTILGELLEGLRIAFVQTLAITESNEVA